ncbi:porin family protein [Flavihumibacter sp. R14]|nr:porin family protein [Flavihumibacter soli]
MKNTLTFLLAFILTISAQAQNISLTPFAGYVFDDHVDYSNGSGTVRGGLVWGADLEFMVNELAGIELFYQHQDTEFDGFNGIANLPEDFDLGANYLMLSGNGYFPVNNDKIRPYAGFGAGVGWFNNKSNDNNLTKFAWNIRLGTKIQAAPNIGVKIQTQLLSAVQAAGGTFYFGTGGAGTGVSSYSSIYQFGFTGGLVYTFGTK